MDVEELLCMWVAEVHAHLGRCERESSCKHCATACKGCLSSSTACKGIVSLFSSKRWGIALHGSHSWGWPAGL